MIAIVVPTIREDCYNKFRDAWIDLVIEHKAVLLAVHDGEKPYLAIGDHKYTPKDVLGKDADLVFNKNDGVRNLGFAYIAKFMPEIEYILTLDDDTKPIGDPIQDHLNALNSLACVSWMSTASKPMRGFPYGIRGTSEVVLSHGVWEGVKDYDAPSQLVNGNPDVVFKKCVIPKGIYYPMCGMNIAFKRKMLPYMYFAPMGERVGLDRFADIWCGITSKRVIDANNWAVVTGFATVLHERASNVFKNLQKEAKGLELNETFWQGDETDPYFKLYAKCRKRWEAFINECLV